MGRGNKCDLLVSSSYDQDGKITKLDSSGTKGPVTVWLRFVALARVTTLDCLSG